MDTYVAIVFDNGAKAFDGLHALWNLDARGDLTVQGAVVVSRVKGGHIDVQTPTNDNFGVRTGIGVGVGLMLGALARRGPPAQQPATPRCVASNLQSQTRLIPNATNAISDERI